MNKPEGTVGEATSATTSSGSTIHDLGYRRYDGARVGASGALTALYTQGLRSVFGFGRPAKAKIVPLLVVASTTLSAVASLVASSISNGQLPVRYAQVIGGQFLMFVLFLAAQVPEVFSRDQQHQLLPLLFTRDVTRESYALARFAAIFTALFAITFAPLLLVYVGEIGMAKDPAATFLATRVKIWPMLALPALSALAMGGLCAALAAWTPRRAYATAAIFGTFMLLAAISTGIAAMTGVNARMAELLDPLRSMRTLALLLFDETTRGMELDPPLSLGVYVALMAGIGLTGLLLLSWRMRRVRT